MGTVAVGLALQDTLSNIFSGIIILLARPFDEGDRISIDNVVGEVFKIGWR
ncbi:mechanosensitive ion channel domain-containing protein [Scytonema sp. PRP1]|uniref:mechanosensitive ion channel domain-containing protein n=1 Tax=Scytonema sp. PRP1 TaxID=3120513 RepID=UPI002FD13741